MVILSMTCSCWGESNSIYRVCSKSTATTLRLWSITFTAMILKVACCFCSFKRNLGGRIRCRKLLGIELAPCEMYRITYANNANKSMTTSIAVMYVRKSILFCQFFGAMRGGISPLRAYT